MFQKFRGTADKETVYQSAENRTQFDSLEYSKTKEGKGQDNAQHDADAIVCGFDFIDVAIESSGKFFYDQFISFR